MNYFGACPICKKGFSGCPHSFAQATQKTKSNLKRKKMEKILDKVIKEVMLGAEDSTPVTKGQLQSILSKVLHY